MGLHRGRESTSTDCKHRRCYFYHYHPLYEPPEHHESQLNHLQPIKGEEDSSWSTVFSTSA